MLIRYLPLTVMVNKENNYQEYKGHTKWQSLISSQFPKNIHFFIHMLIISALYVPWGEGVGMLLPYKDSTGMGRAKAPMFRSWPPLKTTVSTWSAPKDPFSKLYNSLFRSGQIEKILV